MIGWLVLGAAVVAMYRIADAEGRSGLAWGLITFTLCILCAFLIPLPLINVGMFLSFAAMFAAKVASGPR